MESAFLLNKRPPTSIGIKVRSIWSTANYPCAPYEAPERPEIHLHTDKRSSDECVRTFLAYLTSNKYIPG